MTNEQGETRTWVWDEESPHALRDPDGRYFDIDADGFKEYVVDELNSLEAKLADALADAEELAKALETGAPVTRAWAGDHWGPETHCWCNHAFDDDGHDEACLVRRQALTKHRERSRVAK